MVHRAATGGWQGLEVLTAHCGRVHAPDGRERGQGQRTVVKLEVKKKE